MNIARNPHPRRAVWIGFCVEAGWSPDEIAEAFDLGRAEDAEDEDEDDDLDGDDASLLPLDH